MQLFNDVAGVFRGFTEGGLEFHADLVLPYKTEFQSIPMHGQFLLVQLESGDEAVLGRITSLSSEGRLSVGSGEEFNIRAVRENRAVPDDLREQYLKYRVNIRVLGAVRVMNGRIVYVPSHRRLPHVGSKVAFPTGEVLRAIVGHDATGAAIGHYALGEFVYAKQSEMFSLEDHVEWMQLREPSVLVRFPIQSLVSRRSFIFARAGFGKSNLNKLLFSQLYKEPPTIAKRSGKTPVGTLIFDPDGEYFWPDDKGRPGLCDVDYLQNQLVVFTGREAPSAFYGSFVAGNVKLDIRQLRPSDVISIAIPPERQDQQNVAKLRALPATAWAELVDLIDDDGNAADLQRIRQILRLGDQQEAEATAARSNMTRIVHMLHDRSSLLMDLLFKALAAGKICVVDISQMRGTASFVLAGVILRRIFDHNQSEFTKADSKTIPTIAVIEEAQSVLNERAAAAEPFIAWVKEGRKYDLGAVLVTQQPGSIPDEILSQGDNWFIFHLLSGGDLQALRGANAHFSQDLLSSLLNEPIPGQGVFWSSAGEKPYPLPTRVLSFERLHKVRDPNRQGKQVQTFATELRTVREAFEKEARDMEPPAKPPVDGEELFGGGAAPPAYVDNEAHFRKLALKAFEASKWRQRIEQGQGAPWRGVLEDIKLALPTTLQDPSGKAYSLVPYVMTAKYGEQGQGWEARKAGQNNTMHVFKKS